MKIIPSILEKNKNSFYKRLEKIRKTSKEIQIDFMDGKFVKSKGIKIQDLPNPFQYRNTFEAHLMTKNPEKYIDDLRKKGFGRVIFHYEAVKDNKQALEIIKNIRKHGMQPIIAINQTTDPIKINEIIKETKYMQLMGIKPGAEKQKMLPTTTKIIKKIRKLYPDAIIQVDGGINPKTAPKLWKAGANILTSGSYISESKNPEEAIRQLKK